MAGCFRVRTFADVGRPSLGSWNVTGWAQTCAVKGVRPESPLHEVPELDDEPHGDVDSTMAPLAGRP